MVVTVFAVTLILAHAAVFHLDFTEAIQGPLRGDWYFPNGTQLSFDSHKQAVGESRGNIRVDLRHRKQGTSGIYRCDIPTAAVHDDTDISVRDTVYVGLYLNGGEES